MSVLVLALALLLLVVKKVVISVGDDVAGGFRVAVVVMMLLVALDLVVVEVLFELISVLMMRLEPPLVTVLRLG